MRYDCGVPYGSCRGAIVMSSGKGVSGSGTIKTHATSEEAKRCQSRWIREWNDQHPEGPVLIGSKPQRLKPGKNTQSGGSRTTTPTIR